MKEIIDEESEFWCSFFWELNDPMEGVFHFYIKQNGDKNKDENNKKLKILLSKIYNEKEKYKICSFSGKNGFINPLLWGYYANGFKGVAIEIEVKKKNIYKIQYVSEILPITKSKEDINVEDVKEILTRKLNNWQHEYEFRFLVEDNGEDKKNHMHKIGTITNVYFGDPYGNLTNSHDIKQKKAIKNYNDNKKKLKEILDKKNIGHKDVKILNNEIYIDVENKDW